MMPFFRKLRRQLSDDFRPLKYIRYAVGEIVLVVVGILIALQINNWNVRQEMKAREIEMLKLLQSDLKEGLEEFDQSIRQYDRARKSINYLLEYMEADKPYTDSLKQHFFNTTLYWGTSDLTNATYESLKSVGTDLISNSELRDNLALVFEEYDSWIEKDESKYVDLILDAGNNIFNTRFLDYWNGDLVEGQYVGQMVPLDFETLKHDQKYLFFLRSLKNQMKWLVEEPISATKSKVQLLADAIDRELRALKAE